MRAARERREAVDGMGEKRDEPGMPAEPQGAAGSSMTQSAARDRSAVPDAETTIESLLQTTVRARLEEQLFHANGLRAAEAERNTLARARAESREERAKKKVTGEERSVLCVPVSKWRGAGEIAGIAALVALVALGATEILRVLGVSLKAQDGSDNFFATWALLWAQFRI